MPGVSGTQRSLSRCMQRPFSAKAGLRFGACSGWSAILPLKGDPLAGHLVGALEGSLSFSQDFSHGEDNMKTRPERFSFRIYVLFILALLAALLACITTGSVSISLKDTLSAIFHSLCGLEVPPGIPQNIILNVRLPRVLNVALMGAALSLCGAAMQGLLRNPLADGSTLGVSSGAALGAVLALAGGLRIPGSAYGGTMLMAMIFAFLSLLLILSLAYALDRSLATDSIILIGVIFSMFASSLITLVISFAGERVRSITFWTMGSLSSTGYPHAGLLALALLVCGSIILRYAGELNAFALGEESARHMGVHVKRVKLILLVTVSVLIGVCVSIGGTIGFVGLAMPHMARMAAGPNHRRLLPLSMFSGAIFLLLADLLARTLLSPIELPIGVVTSLVGAAAVVLIFYRTRKAGQPRC